MNSNYNPHKHHINNLTMCSRDKDIKTSFHWIKFSFMLNIPEIALTDFTTHRETEKRYLLLYHWYGSYFY